MGGLFSINKNNIIYKQKELNCVICIDLIKNPIYFNCGHSFCSDCIDQYIECSKNRQNLKCPLCRKIVIFQKRKVRNIVLFTVK